MHVKCILVAPSTIYFTEKMSAHPVSSGSVVPGTSQWSKNKASMTRPEGFVLPVGSLGEATAGLLRQSPSYVELVVQTS